MRAEALPGVVREWAQIEGERGGGGGTQGGKNANKNLNFVGEHET